MILILFRYTEYVKSAIPLAASLRTATVKPARLVPDSSWGGCMLSNDQVRQLALALPEAEEHDHRGRPSFRVSKKMFATLWPDERQAAIKLSIADQTALVTADPKTFTIGPWRHQGWTFVNLVKISEEVFGDLLEASWRESASQRAIAVLDAR